MKMSKKRARMLLAAGTALIVLAGGLWYWKKARDTARPLDIVLIQKALDGFLDLRVSGRGDRSRRI